MASGIITFIADTGILDQFVKAACTKYGYQDNIQTPSGLIPNPMPSGVFAQGVIINFCKDILRAYTIEQAVEQTRQNVTKQIKDVIDAVDIQVMAS
jgi:hypothetical protein